MDSLMELVLATNNKNKKVEIESLLKNTGISVVEVTGEFDPEETGSTFEENAYIKAYEAAKIMDKPALADDSGLVIDALNGLPGVQSARFAETTQKRIEKVLDLLKNVKAENRTARFICAMLIVHPDGSVLKSCLGSCEGYIIEEQVGDHGFGYDPIFYIPESGATMAQLTMEEKNKVSHRAKALTCMISWLKNNK